MTNDVNISDLESQLAIAQKQLASALAGRIGGREALAAYDALASAQCALAAAKGEEFAVPFDIGFVPEAAVSEGLLLQTEARAILTFSAMRRMPDGMRDYAGYGVVEFEGCETRFGYPNDEALPGHPLYERGLCGGDGVYEVKNSAWIKTMTIQNRVRFPNTPDNSTSRHFIFTFHDSTFECVTRQFSASLSTKPYAEVFEDIRRRIFWS